MKARLVAFRKSGLRAAAALAALLVLLIVVLTRTAVGKRWVLQEVLAQVEGGINGDLVVRGISAPGFLRGFTFSDVSILGPDGRDFLIADSVRARISAAALLRGDLVLSGVQIWRPRVTIEKLPGQDRFNATTIFLGVEGGDSADSSGAEPASSPDFVGVQADSLQVVPDSLREGPTGGRRRSIILRNARIHDGTLHIRLPLSPDGHESEGILTEKAPDGTSDLRRMTFRDLQLELGQATIRAPEQNGERFEVRNLSFTGEVWPTPFQVTEAEGEVRREGARVLAGFRRLGMPQSRATGQADIRWGGEEGLWVSVHGEADPLSLEDIFFIEDRLPEGRARGPFGLELSNDGLVLDFQGTSLASDLGRIRADGRLAFREQLGFEDLGLEMTGLDLSVTDPWVTDTLPVRGLLDGTVVLAGSPDELELDGEVDLTDPDSVGTLSAAFTGRIGFADGFTASSLELTLAPLEWSALASVSPALTLRGTGAIRVVLTGSLWGDGLGVDGELTHVPSTDGVAPQLRTIRAGRAVMAPTGGASRVVVVGRVRRDSTSLYLSLTGDLSPLSLTALQRSFPSLPLTGEYSGTVEARGSVSDLEVTADLETSGGPLSFRTRFDANRIAASYQLEAEAASDLEVSALVPGLPEPTRFRGHVSAQGRGFALDSLAGVTTILALGGTVGPVDVDSAVAQLSIDEGVMHVQDLFAETEVGALTAAGSFGVASSAPPGELRVGFDSPSLEGLRPFFMEEVDLILDNLTEFDRRILRLEGVDLDTLPTMAEVAVDGAVEGEMVLRGGFSSFTGEGNADFENLRLRTDFVRSGEVSFSLSKPGEGDQRFQARLSTDSLNVGSLGFRRGTADVDLGRWDGRVRVTAARSDTEQYSARGTYALDSLGGGLVNLDQLTLDFDTVRWSLGGPASFAWDGTGYRVRDFQLIRPGAEGMRIRAHGFLPFEGAGDTDFRLDVAHLNLSRFSRTAQMATPMAGVLNLSAHMTGPPADPMVEGFLGGEFLRYGDFRLDSLGSGFSYGNERLRLDLTAFDGDRRVLAADGFIPLDLRVEAEGARIPDAPVDLGVSFDAFPAGIVLAFMETMEEVEGTLSGDLHFGGTAGDVEPLGNLRLADGAASFPALGVRHRAVTADFHLNPDGVVEVDGSLRSGGLAEVSGTVTLRDPLSDPELNLTIDARNFLAASRRDVIGTLSGSVVVSRSYMSPRIDGELTVEQGELRVEEVARSVEVVDLSDPTFFNLVDTTLVTLQPIIRASQNPFLQNLMLSIDLTMAQDSWLRGRELNLEMAGSLGVYWDRRARDLVFLGVLDAVRGVYSVFGRQFQVEEGTVSFPGTPGINPDLNIRALNRLRTQDNDRLDIIATVEGSLLEPRVTLSSNSAFQMAQSDLVSYLVFGRPSYALTTGQSAYARGAAGIFAGATTSLAVGLFSSELGAILTKDVGLDYLAVTQGQNQPLGTQALRGTVATTQVEIGQYLTEDIFAALLWRPGSRGQDQFAALRIESQISDRWTLEGYWEDRFLRSGFWGVDEYTLGLNKVFGFFLYREWGY
jgi:hypothetical protein